MRSRVLLLARTPSLVCPWDTAGLSCSSARHTVDSLSCDTERPLSSVFVISPLIKVMKSQVKDLCNRKQTVVRLSCGVTIQKEAQLRDGIVRYVFSSPEAANENK